MLKLSEDETAKYQESQKRYNTVIPNCQRPKCLRANPGKPRGYIEKRSIKENSKPRKAANKRKREEGEVRVSKKRKLKAAKKSGGRNVSSKRKRETGNDRPKKNLSFLRKRPERKS